MARVEKMVGNGIQRCWKAMVIAKGLATLHNILQ